ncbi:MAG: hypothetical protein KGZ88_11965 [Methylomicrobium sp.]|nr:hypothetical protein [Methylomicrobium sp.]
MARDVALTVRVTEEEERFLELLGKASYHGKTTVAYIGIKEYLELHGFNEWLAERDTKINKKTN